MLVVAALLMLGCAAAAQGPSRPSFQLFFYNSSWDAKTVDVYCDNQQRIAVIRGVNIGRKKRKINYPVVCNAIGIRVRGLGNRYSWSRQWLSVSDGDDVCFDITSRMDVVWRVCSRTEVR